MSYPQPPATTRSADVTEADLRLQVRSTLIGAALLASGAASIFACVVWALTR